MHYINAALAIVFLKIASLTRLRSPSILRFVQRRFRQLLQFLRYPTCSEIQNKDSVEQVLARDLQDFYSTEVRMCGEGRDRLARPGGPPDADL